MAQVTRTPPAIARVPGPVRRMADGADVAVVREKWQKS